MTTTTTAVGLYDLVDSDALAAALADGYVRVRTHPTDPTLRILNYTEKAQYEHVWTNETQTCRGLIVDGDDTVIARPWSKFFNYGQHPEGTLDLTAPVEVTDKLDGSLGILYPGPDGWAIATRGSFASEQAEHATAVLRDRYATFEPATGWTYLFEIIYSANRIVVDYGTTDDLLLLGAVRISDGQAFGPLDVPDWPGPRTASFAAGTLAEALTLAPRPNAEGVVVRFHATGLMVKLKQDDYVALHRLVTGLSEKSVWEHLSAHDGAYTELLAAIPDEFHGWVREVAERLRGQHWLIVQRAQVAHDATVAQVGAESRKAYALAIRDSDPDLAPYCFQLLDGRDPSQAVWRAIKPVGFTPMMHTSEDVA
ncbi:RNA ligase [Cellulomonas rhizosphaerae]|uniref:2'-5' RNA ligase n=1 Tax=Cellulomonas rhizosphaerae TaxID=2293719 RepID=A0A413RJF1_9CELL|nr:RNA ligase [Cellulomonas rhizosphaerae]RHA38697.1 2'-5' RNA ligase [Cellulomonas rhizosphaerae]